MVSILIPCYNSSQFIAETIDSVLAQTYTNWECIIVDDHSTDNSVHIVNSYCQKYPEKFKLYTNPRKGACAARNTAFEKSNGEYIQYLDADDLLSHDKIEEQIKYYKQFGNDIITSCRWGWFSTEPKKVKWQKQYINRDYKNTFDWLIDAWMGKGVGAVSIWLTTREVIEKARQWNEDLTLNDDGEFFSRVLLLVTGKLFFVDNIGVYYRKGITTSITSFPTYEKIYSAFLSYISYKNEILKLIDTIKIRKSLSKLFSGLIYRHYLRYPDIVELARKEIEKLEVNPQPCGGKKFNLLVKILGFDKALKLKYWNNEK